MVRSGRNIRVDELNRRRRRAVELRLRGVSIAQSAKRSGLSAPTVIDAVKAYRRGGWAAVPVAPRGRGVRKAPAPARAPSPVKHLSSPAGRAVPPEARLATSAQLRALEDESIHILREVVAESENPVMLYSLGKDSSVLLHLARKAFFPAPPPFPLLHVDTTWKFRDMYVFRDRVAAESGLRLIVHVNQEGVARGINPFTHGSAMHTDVMKTQALRQAIEKYRFDAAFGGARRDEEKSRAKERVCSLRSAQHRWDPKNQRPELWKLYNLRKRPGESIRAFPLSNWTELDVWQYIRQEKIAVVPLYFAAERPVVERDGTLIMVDDARMPLGEGERPALRRVRFRTLGCYPLTGAIESPAATLDEIIEEMLRATVSERQGRVIDRDQSASMEKKKQEGYF
jgi:sulfate adenylyltransferase subunit 2